MDVVIALAPPIGVGILFFIAMRALMQADRKERAAKAEADSRPSTDTE